MLAQRYFNDPGARIAALTSVATCSADQKIKIFKKNLDNVWEPETEWKVSWYEQLSRRAEPAEQGWSGAVHRQITSGDPYYWGSWPSGLRLLLLNRYPSSSLPS